MENYDYDYGQEAPSAKKSIKGYQIIIVVLAVILGALSFIYFRQMNELKAEYAIEKDTLENRFAALRDQYDNLRTENDTMALNLSVQRHKADSLFESLTRERSISRSQIREYQKQLGTMRDVMQNYVKQIDSLNTLNKTLIRENVEYRQQVSSERLRADIAEEKADELTTKIRKGSVVGGRNIRLKALRGDRDVRAARAEYLRVDVILAANELAEPGEKPVYVRILGPDGYLLSSGDGGVFSFEGEMKNYSATRDVDYQNEDIDVSLYYRGAGITAGQYRVEVYFDGHMIGSAEIALR